MGEHSKEHATPQEGAPEPSFQLFGQLAAGVRQFAEWDKGRSARLRERVDGWVDRADALDERAGEALGKALNELSEVFDIKPKRDDKD